MPLCPFHRTKKSNNPSDSDPSTTCFGTLFSYLRLRRRKRQQNKGAIHPDNDQDIQQHPQTPHTVQNGEPTPHSQEEEDKISRVDKDSGGRGRKSRHQSLIDWPIFPRVYLLYLPSLVGNELNMIWISIEPYA
jgi:hypothetical protein